jgi:hypothetical protein
VTTFLPRSAWTPTAASGATLGGSILRGVAYHWPGTTQDVIGAVSQEAIAARLRSYRTYHVQSRGWRDIGYNFAIDQAGRVWMCRSTAWKGDLVGAHCASKANPDANHEYVGVLLLLGDQEKPSAAMVAAFRDWRARFLAGWPGRSDLRGHREVPGATTSCPGPAALAAEPLFAAPAAPPDARTVDLSQLRAAAVADPKRPQGGTTPGAADDVRVVEAALVREGLLEARWAGDGSYGAKTVEAYARWQRRLGYTGDDADGIPGMTSLRRLGEKYGFRVVS